MKTEEKVSRTFGIVLIAMCLSPLSIAFAIVKGINTLIFSFFDDAKYISNELDKIWTQ